MYLSTNVEQYPNPDVLSYQEIKVVLEVIDLVLEFFLCGRTRAGTLILDGQKYNQEKQQYEDAQCILRANLQQGAFRAPRPMTSGLFPARVDDNWPEEAINAMLNLGGDSPYMQAYQWMIKAGSGGRIPTGIYRAEELKVLVLNSTYGRFLASFYINQDGRLHKGSKGGYSTAVLYATALTLQLLSADRPVEDAILARGVDEILRNASENQDVSECCREAALAVRSAFHPKLAMVRSVIDLRSEIRRGDGRLFFEPQDEG